MEILVCVKRFAPLEELAGLLGGVVGVSRVVTSEGAVIGDLHQAIPALVEALRAR